MKVCVEHTKSALTESMLLSQKKMTPTKNDSSTGESTALCDDGNMSELEDSKLPAVSTPKKKRSAKTSNKNIGRSRNVKKRTASRKQSTGSDCDDSYESSQSLL